VRVVLLGPPGGGKSTQARELAREWDVPHIAIGDMLREAVAAGTPLGREARGYMESGALVPDETIIELMADRLRQPGSERGFILEGFPRTIAQAEALDRLLDELGQSLDHIFSLEVSEPELRQRLTARREGGGELRRREDDSEAMVGKRLDVYARHTVPLLDYYRGRGRLETVSGEGPVDTIRDVLRTRLRPGAPS
jgi:adenylate kinase